MSSKLSINSRLRKFRIDQGLNQTEMAELFNISAFQYSKIESGKCDLNIHHIKALSGNINQPFETLLGVLQNDQNPMEAGSVNTFPTAAPNNKFEHLQIPFEEALHKLINFCKQKNYNLTIDERGEVLFKVKEIV